jgi:hypothetical protein
MLTAILLPFRRTFRRLELERHWWHRFSVPLFLAAILFTFTGSSVLSYLAFAPPSSSEPVILERLHLFDTNSKIDDPSSPDAGGKVALMPNGTTVDFPYSMSDEAIKAEWTRAKDRRSRVALLWAGLLAILGTLILSYLLQGLYRALLYLIFGSRGAFKASDV